MNVTADGTAGPNLFVASSGNVGIGTTGPGTKLQVKTEDSATNSITDILSLIHTTTGTQAAGFGSGIGFQNERASDGILITDAGRIAAVTESTDGLNGLAFYTRPSAGLAEKMRIQYDGNVGIGTTTPANALVINGADNSQLNITRS